MHEIFLSDGADLAISKKACQGQGALHTLNQLGIMMGFTKKRFAATATADQHAAARGAIFCGKFFEC